MTIQHNTITGSDLHEPKGVASAAVNKVYVANGSGSGTWTTIGTAGLANDSVNADKIEDGAVGTAALADVNVTTGKLAASAVSSAKLADGAVTNVKLGNLSVSATKLLGTSGNGATTDVVSPNGSGGFTYQTFPTGRVFFFNPSTPYSFSAVAYTKVAPTTTASAVNVSVTEATTARLTYTGTSTVKVKIEFDSSIKQSSGGDQDIITAIYKNGALLAGSESTATYISGDFVQVSGTTTATAATNDYFEMFVKNLGGSNTIELNKMAMTLNCVGV
tara:strand:+ start:1317 stop:2141 length:825 start_codon:yes stop_codon:yes gene_type:complete